MMHSYLQQACKIFLLQDPCAETFGQMCVATYEGKGDEDTPARLYKYTLVVSQVIGPVR